MTALPDDVLKATSKHADIEVPQDLRMDVTRGFDTVHPPMAVYTWRGEHVPIAFKDDPDKSHVYNAFMRKVERDAQEKGADSEIPIERTIAYEQDGLMFDAQGRIVVEVMDFATRLNARRQMAMREATKKAQQAASDALKAAGFDPSTIEISAKKRAADISATDVVSSSREGPNHRYFSAEDRPHAGTDGEKLDLPAWARGEKHNKVPFFAIKKAFREQHGRDIKDKANALEFLAEIGAIPNVS